MSDNYFDQRACDWDKNFERINRTNILYNRISEIVSLCKDNSILDFGCGTGSLGFNFINTVKTVCFADTSSGMLLEVEKKAKEQRITNYRIVNLDKETITESYDLVVSLLALHHIESFEEVFLSLLSQINVGGYIAISDLDVEDGSFHYPQKVPHNGIDRNIIINCLTKNNYELICNETIYVQEKIVDDKPACYPIFLIIGKSNQQS